MMAISRVIIFATLVAVLSGGSVSADVLFGAPASAVPAPTITSGGGLEAWAIGSLEPHQDLVISLGP